MPNFNNSYCVVFYSRMRFSMERERDEEGDQRLHTRINEITIRSAIMSTDFDHLVSQKPSPILFVPHKTSMFVQLVDWRRTSFQANLILIFCSGCSKILLKDDLISYTYVHWDYDMTLRHLCTQRQGAFLLLPVKRRSNGVFFSSARLPKDTITSHISNSS